MAPDGSPLNPNHVSNHFQDLVGKMGLPPIRLHDPRHGAATMALAAGVDMKVVQEASTSYVTMSRCVLVVTS
ncbi:tyrosine-type recombinase/integrase [Streptoalloteichus hindustanus]|uniref:Phage integrase family protein n=1 Tax=Streptoalloteichus hindustanus TaxID=2017 RepID=A0A1M5MJE7_STRHI|nr:tyrosine-type recombinase/integrase [Streptoalloteichus hindustanus]SHG77212.1 Phage integrase family protein [Streptoalloteichus hindustanus]